MSFEASDSFNKIIWKLKGQLVHKLLFLSLVPLDFSFRLFRVAGRTVNAGFMVAEAILIAIAALVFFYNVNMLKVIIVKIGKQVYITDDEVSIIPFTFNTFSWNKKQNPDLVFKLNELNIRKTDNPLMFTRALGNKIFLIKDRQKEAYIVYDEFDEALKTKLMEILVEVTPAEMLRSGRSRHY